MKFLLCLLIIGGIGCGSMNQTSDAGIDGQADCPELLDCRCENNLELSKRVICAEIEDLERECRVFCEPFGNTATVLGCGINL